MISHAGSLFKTALYIVYSTRALWWYMTILFPIRAPYNAWLYVPLYIYRRNPCCQSFGSIENLCLQWQLVYIYIYRHSLVLDRILYYIYIYIPTYYHDVKFFKPNKGLIGYELWKLYIYIYLNIFFAEKNICPKIGAWHHRNINGIYVIENNEWLGLRVFINC